MIYSDEWTEGLNNKQQNLILTYVMNNFQAIPGMGGYKTLQSIEKFLKSPKGRRALNKYLEFKTQTTYKEKMKYYTAKLHFIRAFFNPADIINANGELIDSDGNTLVDTDLRRLGDLAYCIDGIESEIIGHGPDGKPIRKIKIKLCDRNKSYEIIKELFKLLEDEEEKDFDEKSVFEMSDEERENEIKRLIGLDNKLIEFTKGGNNGDGKDKGNK